MLKEIDFSRNLIKGRIAEVVFQQMIQNEDRYAVIPFGYEHTMPTLAQYQHLAEVQSIMKNISDAPDFVLISKDHSGIYLVEVKYRSKIDPKDLKKCCDKLKKRWEHPWLFIATPTGFYCDLCKNILATGDIKTLPESWVKKIRQNSYLKLLNEFEP